MKYAVPHSFEDGDLEGKTLICITNKYGNFTIGTEYPIEVKNRYLNGNPGEYKILDDENDEWTILKSDIGKRFRIK